MGLGGPNSRSAAHSVHGASVMRNRGAEQEHRQAAALQNPPGQEHGPERNRGEPEENHRRTTGEPEENLSNHRKT